MLIVTASGLRDGADTNAMIARFDGLIRREPDASVHVVMLLARLQSTGGALRARACLWGPAVDPGVLPGVARRGRPLFDSLDQAKDWLATEA